ncbi:MmcQ/YjbR family DNA-binding protein [Flavihumibacter sp. UBA7668]|uniref:MmcQ/YjbR family DNA-binding protein n=1 Tax=Flavihumibacter sp. UBA7668 TaxID=1946542 RepID=UPI0025C44D42|nr:MmcQ/YjbR family DNA-binding protein [Flavihumibacter sp. UBA7668]
MVSNEQFRILAKSFDQVETSPHFDKESFRVRKKIFATLNVKNQEVSVKLNLIDQSVFCAFDKAVIYPVEGSWGKLGWTLVNLKKIRKSMLQDLLTVAYCTVAPPILAQQYKSGE